MAVGPLNGRGKDTAVSRELLKYKNLLAPPGEHSMAHCNGAVRWSLLSNAHLEVSKMRNWHVVTRWHEADRFGRGTRTRSAKRIFATRKAAERAAIRLRRRGFGRPGWVVSLGAA